MSPQKTGDDIFQARFVAAGIGLYLFKSRSVLPFGKKTQIGFGPADVTGQDH
jgi:hypothetical protein